MRNSAADLETLRASGEVARLDGVTVRYRVPLDPSVSLKEFVLRGGSRRYAEHLAIDRVDLGIRHGEVLGVIGRNGAGKTTLLKVIARILHSSAGRLRIDGRVATLIDLIGPFHLELTGRENALLGAAVVGFRRREAMALLPGIESFCELGTFFDAPMRTWSAGMIVRLGFALATSVDADLLVIDEALGVGDAAFQQKCAERMADYRRRGTAFIVVSHDVHRLAAMSDRIVWMEQGRVRSIGAPEAVVNDYLGTVPG
jgi:lipopolysaccharide transport system ATP-binding protein